LRRVCKENKGRNTAGIDGKTAQDILYNKKIMYGGVVEYEEKSGTEIKT